MELLGLTTNQAIAAAVAAALAVTGLYLIRPRRRRVTVAYVALWEGVVSGARSSAWVSFLHRIGSWLLALLCAGLVVGALADPRQAAGDGTLHVLWLDGSLSMQTRPEPGGPTLHERALERAHEYVDRMPRGDVALVLGVGAHPFAAPISGEPAELHRAIDSVVPTDAEADVARAASLALDAAPEATAAARLVLFTDGPFVLPPALEERVQARFVTEAVLLFGGAAPANLAITALAARPHPLDRSRAEVLLEIRSYADVPATVEVVLSTEGRSIDVLSLDVPARGRVRRFFDDVSGLDSTLEAALTVTEGPTDALAADDVAFARIASQARTRVAVVSRDNGYLDAALLLDEALDVVDVPLGGAPDATMVDVAIFDGVLPPAAYSAPAIYLCPDTRTGGVGPLEVTADAPRPRFDVLDDEHPLLRWASLRSVNVASALAVTLAEGDSVVAGDEGVPLIVTGERDGARFVALTFDARQSDLPLRIAWPVLLLDAIALLTPEGDREPSFARAGEPFRVALPAGATEATLSTSSGPIPVPVLDGQASLELASAGIHRLATEVGEVVVAVSPAAGAESDLRAPGPIDLGDGPLSEPVLAAPRAARHPWEWMALGALMILVVEGITFHRRWTV